MEKPAGCICAVAATVGALLVTFPVPSAHAQQSPSPFALDILRGAIGEDPSPSRAPSPAGRGALDDGSNMQPMGQVTFQALMTEDGQRLEQGLAWRVYSIKDMTADGRPRLVNTLRDASPVVRLAAGDYYVTVAFGRANLTRKISVAANGQTVEPFALNVGLLKVTAQLGNRQLANGATFDVFSDDRDQFGQRSRVITGAHPGALLRLNSGLYQIVSQYGDANSTIQADLTVEPGKLTEAVVVHQVARATFKLVTRAGGEAQADTQWSVLNRQGDIVKESAGALPVHTLAPGTYTVTARSQGRQFRRTFAVKSGDVVEVEVMMQ